MSFKTEGLLLQEIPYLGRKKILKVFTPEEGLLSFFIRSSPVSPFCLAEWVYRKTESELYTVQDVSLIDPLLHLRNDYHTLLAAGAIAQELLRTQLEGKGAPALFALTLLYLRKLGENPDILLASFRLKLLLHEGLLSKEPDPAFTDREWDKVEALAFSRTLSPILNVREAPQEKIKHLFDMRTERDSNP